jgi:hypothetical protein
MTLQRTTAGSGNLTRALLLVAAVIILMAVLTVIFGVNIPGPSYQIVPDPASGMGLPF